MEAEGISASYLEQLLAVHECRAWVRTVWPPILPKASRLRAHPACLQFVSDPPRLGGCPFLPFRLVSTCLFPGCSQLSLCRVVE